MVTFFCNSCGQYLKKKQAEQHVGYCTDRLSCNDCKKTITGFAEVKAHTTCGAPVSTKPGKAEAKKIKIDDIQLDGLKNVLRRIVKRAEGQKINRDVLRRLAAEVYKQNDQALPENFDALFKQKVAGARNLESEGLLVKYSRA